MHEGLPSLPRDQWEAHKNFPDHVLLVGSHQNFRRANHILIEEGLNKGRLSTMELRFRQWISGMRSHERYEERKLYPFLARRYGVPQDDGAIAEAERGHEALHVAYDRVIAAFASADRDAVVEALRGHASVLSAHLDQEEDMVIPALLELSSREFHDYYNRSLPELLRMLEARGF